MKTLLRHPDYDARISQWEKFRLAFEGGNAFLTKYLQYFSSRETNADFKARKAISYAASHAKAAIQEIINSLYQRLNVNRIGGPDSYQNALVNVDFNNATMTYFMGRVVLPELLSIGKVGIFVDNGIPENDIVTQADKIAARLRPYLYIYRAEDILNWCYDDNGLLIDVLLRVTKEVTDKETGLVTGYAEYYKRYTLSPDGNVTETVLTLNTKKHQFETLSTRTVPELSRIPLIIATIPSLMEDVADYQIALTNLASADMAYAMNSNFVVYTEQVDKGSTIEALLGNSMQAGSPDSSAGGTDEYTEPSSRKAVKSITIGGTAGRTYSQGLERPGYINPSTAPMLASMQKQEKLQTEIRRLVNLAVVNMNSQRVSAESREFDDRGMESGLSCIGLELEKIEKSIAGYWQLYDGGTVAEITYPRTYTLQTDDEIVSDMDALLELRAKLTTAQMNTEGIDSLIQAKQMLLRVL